MRHFAASHDEYLASFRHLRLGGFALARAERPWGLTRCRLSRCVVEHGIDGAPWAASGVAAERTASWIFSGSAEAQLRVDGREVSRETVCAVPGGVRVSLVARRPGDWYVVTVPDLEGSRPDPGESGPEDRTSIPIRVRAEDLARLRTLAGHLLRAVETAGPAGLPPDAETVLEQPLLAELARLSRNLRVPASGGASPRIDRRAVLLKVEELLDARPSEPVYVADLCDATGLPERTLRYVLVEQYGASPIRVLRNRRLCQLRRRLLAEDDGAESLARIAARHGFWHMGTLAADYRQLFGELPSETRRAVGTAAEPLAASPRREDHGRSDEGRVEAAAR